METIKIPFPQYLCSPEISKSSLDLIERSPAHFRYYLDNPQTREETPAMRFGSIVHTAVLEPDLFDSQYIAMPEGLKKPTISQINAAKPSAKTIEQVELWNSFQEMADGKIIINEQEKQQAFDMRQAIMDCSKAKQILSVGEPEQSIFWNEKNTSVDCKARADWVHGNQQSLLVDIKTTEDARPGSFVKSIINFRYDVQAAHYTDGFQIDKFVFIAVEKKPPYGVAVYVVDGELFARGDKARIQNLGTYAECSANDYWPSYPDEIQTLILPRWAA